MNISDERIQELRARVAELAVAVREENGIAARNLAAIIAARVPELLDALETERKVAQVLAEQAEYWEQRNEEDGIVRGEGADCYNAQQWLDWARKQVLSAAEGRVEEEA